MRRVLVRSGKSPLVPVSAEASLGSVASGIFANNVGNYLFTDAVQRLLSTQHTEVVSDSYSTERRLADDGHIARINEEFDHLVLPLANAFRENFTRNLRRMTHVIERLDIPVSVVGVGAQLPLFHERVDSPEAREVYTAFVGAVLEKSPSIGVRGAFTKEFVEGLGFDDDQVEVIGCPSVYLRGSGHTVRNPEGALAPTDPVALNVTAGGEGVVRSDFAAFFASQVERFPGSTYVGQVSSELSMLLWGRYTGTPADPRYPMSLDHPLHREDRVRFFVDSETWLRFMATQRFVLGTRIHGTIAGVLAGTPSLIAVHDSRTRELAEYHEIPHRSIMDLGADTRLEDLYAETDYTAFNAGMKPRFQVLSDFLVRHGLEHIELPGMDGSAFDRAWNAMARPPAVRGLNAPEPEFRRALGERLAWLRQGVEADAAREDLAYHPPFAPEDQAPVPVRRELRRLQRKVDRLDANVGKLRERNQRLAAQVRELRSAAEQPAPRPLGRLRSLVRRRTP